MQITRCRPESRGHSTFSRTPRVNRRDGDQPLRNVVLILEITTSIAR
jgi:hypothetical protein